ncbi:hypothetical protein SKAU_G00258790 [Synaphobranchus kaupii]|uniref:Uncharacterized protein n=1 Tax=Synaphobranchus kaupii TaxID=118154 RepID=A0A9Q1IQI8_SYNKA|nr:hypothetical protein SKAU_G00258790 [Synaphobranchus kaupii]
MRATRHAKQAALNLRRLKMYEHLHRCAPDKKDIQLGLHWEHSQKTANAARFPGVLALSGSWRTSARSLARGERVTGSGGALWSGSVGNGGLHHVTAAAIYKTPPTSPKFPLACGRAHQFRKPPE